MSEKKIIIVGFFITIIIIAGFYFLTSKNNQPTAQISSYQSTDSIRPKVELKKTSFDLGSMKVSEDKSYDFTIKNIGKATLQLSNITSSCGCTFGQIIYDNIVSKRYGMHAKSDDVIEIAPGKQALVRVIYVPSIMPVYGSVEREVYLNTNDPNSPKLTFKVIANVK